MKKLILGLSIMVLIFSSCSKSDNVVAPTTNSSTTFLPKSINTLTAVNNLNATIQITYNGNRIYEYIEGARKDVYTYTGDLVTKVESFNSNILEVTTDYAYNSNNYLISKINFLVGSASKSKTIYSYNLDSTASYTLSNIVISTNVETIVKTGKLTFLNGNITKNEFTDITVSPIITNVIINYEYDTKNNLGKNILNYAKLYDYRATNSLNNLIKETRNSTTINNGITTTSPIIVTNVTYVYNSDNYPIVKKEYTFNNITNANDLKYTITFTY